MDDLKWAEKDGKQVLKQGRKILGFVYETKNGWAYAFGKPSQECWIQFVGDSCPLLEFQAKFKVSLACEAHQTAIKDFLHGCIGHIGLSFNPDTSFADYIADNGAPLFTDAEAKRLTVDLGQVLELCEALSLCRYDICLAYARPGFYIETLKKR